FFFGPRQRFLACAIEQRAVSRGLTGLLSSRVDLLPHQVEVARRVLEDPIQRYLLADEVGLGKTIEAGFIIRQSFLDDPDASVLVIVPPLLKDQWTEELDQKFDLITQPRLMLIGSDELYRLAPGASFDLVVIDEAQHVAELAAKNTFSQF